MMSSTPTAPPARVSGVVAVLVVTDGEQWLPNVLGTIAAQGHETLDMVVVDNASTDGGAALLDRRIRPERLLRLPRRVGFARAVAAAMAHEAIAGADLVLLLHDDLALAPDAVEVMVNALEDDPELAIVGPKLREWGEEPVLQEVGMTADRFGRAENHLEPGELDQGQHDRRREVLYVSTAGMLVRADVLRRPGALDQRYVALRDDLDLCWQTWLAGYRVEVVPAAVGYHVAAASRGLRPLTRRSGAAAKSWQAREYAERHALATMLKCYGLRQLLWVLPAVVLLAFGKVLGFVATRRFGNALAVVRAHAWNLAQLPMTLRRRRVVQRQRRRTDADVLTRFAPGLPRVRAYAEAIGDWLAGGSSRALLEEEDGAGPQRDQGSGPVAFVRRHPSAIAGMVLLVIYVIGLGRLLGPGQLIGGEVAPWPSTPREFLRLYASPWNGEPAASAGFASPIQAVLGIVSFLGFGSRWLAQRLVVLGLVPLAWYLALRAGRLLTSRPWPRVVGATFYVLSPVLLGALGQGRWSVLVAGALLPGLVHAAVRAVGRGLAPGPSWRATAVLALTAAVVVSAAPSLWPLPAAVVAAAAVLSLRGVGTVPALLRLLVAVTAAGGLVAPWLFSAAVTGEVAYPTASAVFDLPLWRALLMVPETAPGLVGMGAAVPAVTAGAIILAGSLMALRLRPAVSVGLLAVIVASAAAAALVARSQSPIVPLAFTTGAAWPPGLLLPGALAVGGLGVVAARSVPRQFGELAFGGRQLLILLAAGIVGVGLLAAVGRLATGPYPVLTRDPELVPAFVGADVEQVGPYRVVLLTVRGDNAVLWDVVAAQGPSMTSYGTLRSPEVLDAVGRGVQRAVGGADPTAGARLGVAGVRYVVVAPEAAALTQTLDLQPGLEPAPSGGGRVYRVSEWLPRAALLTPDQARALEETGSPGPVAPGQVLPPVADHVYRGRVDATDGGLLVVAEAPSPRWRASVDGVPLPRAEVGPPPTHGPTASGASAPAPVRGVGDDAAAPPPLNAFQVMPGGDPVALAQARVSGSRVHRLILALQALLALVVASLALRPPRSSAHRRGGDQAGTPVDQWSGRPGDAAAAVPAGTPEDGEHRDDPSAVLP